MHQAEIALSQISQERKEELLKMAMELQVTLTKEEILLLLIKREKLDPVEGRALQAILLFEM